MKQKGKVGLQGAVEAALAGGMRLRPSSAADLDRHLEASIQDVSASYTPSTPARLKPGRPCKDMGRQVSRMKGVRLEVAFLAQLEARLKARHLSFSSLVQDLLGAWMLKDIT